MQYCNDAYCTEDHLKWEVILNDKTIHLMIWCFQDLVQSKFISIICLIILLMFDKQLCRGKLAMPRTFTALAAAEVAHYYPFIIVNININIMFFAHLLHHHDHPRCYKMSRLPGRAC